VALTGQLLDEDVLARQPRRCPEALRRWHRLVGDAVDDGDRDVDATGGRGGVVAVEVFIQSPVDGVAARVFGRALLADPLRPLIVAVEFGYGRAEDKRPYPVVARAPAWRATRPPNEKPMTTRQPNP
jgi:hypothetical protein